MIRKRNLVLFLSILVLLLSISLSFYNRLKVVTIPIELYSDFIVVPTTINGITYHFILDTGAPTCISEDIFKKLKLEVKDSIKGVDFFGNKKWVKQTTISSLQLKNFEINNRTVSVVKVLQPFKHKKIVIDGYLGSDTFTNLIIKIDTKNKQLKVSKSHFNMKHEKTSSVKFNTFGTQNTPLLLTSYSDGSCKDTTLFDTGSRRLYEIKMDSYNKLISNNSIKKENIIGTVASKDNYSSGLFGKHNDTTINYFAKIDSVSIGKLVMHGFPVLTCSNKHYSIIGAQFLKYGIVTFDFKNKVFFFEPYK
ncbi:hypothetical protein EOD40_00460 [Flavobacterium sufflavum]|uniref:Peptidase A2 domain-containing protein n=1 Tax=Flavobacterium sufflavum TaxID=1921138 RepID=A0A3S2V7H4_9FLAO|nr:retropepsin-like aspartic protease [Flavobacterium sufflavum]RVT79618.1 hypothetical protein EOD40_00460 [Flavobacterium sufflavum]